MISSGILATGSPEGVGQSAHSAVDSHSDMSQDDRSANGGEDDEDKVLVQVATEVAEALDDNDLTTVYEHISSKSSIPPGKDKELLEAGKDKLERWLEEQEKYTLRKGFKEAIRRKEETARNPNDNQ